MVKGVQLVALMGTFLFPFFFNRSIQYSNIAVIVVVVDVVVIIVVNIILLLLLLLFYYYC